MTTEPTARLRRPPSRVGPLVTRKVNQMNGTQADGWPGEDTPVAVVTGARRTTDSGPWARPG